MRKWLMLLIVALFLVIDFFEFHDFLEPKTLPEFLTGLTSVLVFVLIGMDLFRRNKNPQS